MKRQEYNHKELTGMDADIETSLKEYGLAWIETETEYLFYYGIKMDIDPEYNEAYYSRFDFQIFDKDWDFKAEFDWVNWEAIESYIGMDFDEMLFTQKISDLLNYYGYENVFGSSYWEGLTYDRVINGL